MSAPKNDERPNNVADMLAITADFLDTGDAAYRALERVTGRPLPVALGMDIQRDIRRIARLFYRHRWLDRLIYRACFR